MIEQWREASDSVERGGKKHTERTKDGEKSSGDHHGSTKRERESKNKDGKRRASSGSPTRSPSGERYSVSQSRELSRSRAKKTKARTSLDGKLRAKSADGYGRKTDRAHKYQDRPEDADGGEYVQSLISPFATNYIYYCIHKLMNADLYFYRIDT
jgi:hypothetical protein